MNRPCFVKTTQGAARRQGGKMTKEPDKKSDDLAAKVIGAAIEVHRVLGPGYLEHVYEQALAIELKLRGVPFVQQKPMCVDYKGHAVGEGRVDFLIDSCLIVELKAVDVLAPIHIAQVMSYLKAMNLPLGILINFNVTLLKQGIRRVIRSAPLDDLAV